MSSGSLSLSQLIVTITQGKPQQPSENPSSNEKVMLDGNGNRYSCVLPARTPPDLDSSGHAEPSRDEVAALLDTTLSKTCLYRQEGIWTFEACYKKQTRQFRKGVPQVLINGVTTYTIEASPSEDFSCGSHDEEDKQELAIKSDQILTGSKMSYASLQLKGGAGCVMTGGNRSSEIRFTYGGPSQSSKENTLTMVKEFPTCHYIYVLSVPVLCSKFPFFSSPATLSSIDCFPRAPDKKKGTCTGSGSFKSEEKDA